MIGDPNLTVTARNEALVYKELHEGLAADKYFDEYVSVPSHVPVRGRMSVIDYWKRTPNGTDWMSHDFSERAMPSWGWDSRGKLWIYTGRYRVTTHGIEDRDPGDERRERLPSLPKRLILLGTIRWFGYKEGTFGDRAEGVIQFEEAKAPILAHDERGNLFVLRGNYSLKTQENAYMKRNRRVRLTNPSGGGSEKKSVSSVGKRVLVASAVIGVVGVASAVGLDMAVARITWFNGKSPYYRMGAKAGAGVVLGTAAIMLGAPASVGLGIGIGAVVSAGADAYQEYARTRASGRAAGQGFLGAGQQEPSWAQFNQQHAAAGAGVRRG